MRNSLSSPERAALTTLQGRLDLVSRSVAELGEPREEVAPAAREATRRVGAVHPAAESLHAEVQKLRMELDGLRTAMINRSVIEQAKGMVMLLLDVDEDAAFSHLRDASNRTNRRVSDLAAELVRTRAGEWRR